jgi:hypothetical protein
MGNYLKSLLRKLKGKRLSYLGVDERTILRWIKSKMWTGCNCEHANDPLCTMSAGEFIMTE